MERYQRRSGRARARLPRYFSASEFFGPDAFILVTYKTNGTRVKNATFSIRIVPRGWRGVSPRIKSYPPFRFLFSSFSLLLRARRLPFPRREWNRVGVIKSTYPPPSPSPHPSSSKETPSLHTSTCTRGRTRYLGGFKVSSANLTLCHTI